MTASSHRRMHMSPRLKFILGLILAPAAIYLLGHASTAVSEPLAGLEASHRITGVKPAFHPYAEETDDGYGLHLIDEQLDVGRSSNPWGLEKIGLGRLTAAGKRPLILITGGAGQLGQALIPRLTQSYTVHILDISPRPSHLPSENVVYHRGSVLPASPSLRNLLTSHTFDGIIHLAAVSLDTWCAPKEADCLAVNEGGVKAVMKQVEGIAAKAAKSWRSTQVPWVVLGSSMEVYGDGGGIVDEVTERKASNALGRTKAKGEEAFEAVMAGQKGKGGIKGMILRFSDVYGYSHESSIPESFVPSLVGNAITSMPIQYDSDIAPIDLVHVDDAVDGVLKAIRYLKEDVGAWGSTSVNLVSGKTWAVEQVVERARQLTNAMSPVMDIGDHKTSIATSQYHNAHALNILQWTPAITLPDGFTRTFKELTSAMHAYSLDYLHSGCAPTAEFPSPNAKAKTHKADERNKPLHKLDRCLVQVAFAHDKYLHHMKCSDGKHCTVDGEYVSGYNWNGTFWIVHASKKGERKARVSFEEEKGMGYLGAPRGLMGHSELAWVLVDEDDTRYETDFDIEVAPDSSYLRMSLPAAKKQVHSVANVSASTTWFAVDDENHLGGDRFDMRMNVVCCPTEGDWPLVLDDYESADVHFGHTGQIPFNSSHRAHTCQRATESARNTLKQLQAFSEASSTAMSTSESGTLSLVDRPHDWATRDLPACWNDCSAPVICVQTGSCRCVLAECPARRENPLLILKHAEKPAVASSPSKLGALAPFSPKLANDLSKLSFEDLLLPSARSYLAKHPDFIKVHVLDGYEGQEAVEASECHKLGDKHCFSADSILYKAMRSIQVSAEEADLIMLPLYQQCKGQPFMLHDLVGEAKVRVPGVVERTKKMGMVLTHDWGICASFAWEVWSARQNQLKPDWPLNDAIVMQVMGDYDSPCYRPHQDVVIPARSCRSNALRETFGRIEDIRPAHERTKLLTWAGTAWGTGKSDRMRLTCGRGGAGEKELVKGAGPQSVFYSWDYMNELSHARFCPQPRGIAGWSPRTNDAIYAGCIPVIIAEGTHFPFSNFLDWTKFSVKVHPTELDHIEQVLAAIPLERVEELQANLAIVREGFLYSTDEKPEEETKRRGPMWFALHEAGMRLRTKYPTYEVDAIKKD